MLGSQAVPRDENGWSRVRNSSWRSNHGRRYRFHAANGGLSKRCGEVTTLEEQPGLRPGGRHFPITICLWKFENSGARNGNERIGIAEDRYTHPSPIINDQMRRRIRTRSRIRIRLCRGSGMKIVSLQHVRLVRNRVIKPFRKLVEGVEIRGR